MKVYIIKRFRWIMGIRAPYESEEPVIAYTDCQQATDHYQRLKKLLEDTKSLTTEELKKIIPDEDPFPYWYTVRNYYLEEVNLCRHVDEFLEDKTSILREEQELSRAAGDIRCGVLRYTVIEVD